MRVPIGARAGWLLTLAVLVLAALALSRSAGHWSALPVLPVAWAFDALDVQARIDLSAMDGLTRLALAGGALTVVLLLLLALGLALGLALPLALLAGLVALVLALVVLGGVLAALVGLPLIGVGLLVVLLLSPLLLLAWPLVLLLRWLVR